MNKTSGHLPRPCAKGLGFDSTNGGFQWIVINGCAIEVHYIVQALRSQIAAEDAVDPEGLFRGLDGIRARAAIAEDIRSAA